MRMLFLVVLLIIPGMARAVNSDCRQITGQNAQTTCENTAGCHWEYSCFPCNEDHYCPGNNNEQILCSDVGNGNFDKSDEGSESSAECYKSIEGGCYYSTLDDPDNNCRHYNTNDNPYRCGDSLMIAAHMESNTCYYNQLSCKEFDGCDSDNIFGEVYWENNAWSVGVSCRCYETADYHAKNCVANMYKVPIQQTVPSVGQIQYEIDHYHCTSCDAGHYVHATDGFNQSANPGCSAQYISGDKAVCKCTDAAKGYYSEGFNISYPITDTNTYTHEPYLKPCPAGQTTPGTGATFAGQCEYNGNTQFCDAKGCFTLGTDFENWIFPN